MWLLLLRDRHNGNLMLDDEAFFALFPFLRPALIRRTLPLLRRLPPSRRPATINPSLSLNSSSSILSLALAQLEPLAASGPLLPYRLRLCAGPLDW